MRTVDRQSKVDELVIPSPRSSIPTSAFLRWKRRNPLDQTQ
jgi:hypothetical protein